MARMDMLGEPRFVSGCWHSCDVLCSRLDLAKASDQSGALDDLEKACDPATFGVDQQDVFDTSFRKAGKLDKEYFSLNVDVDGLGILEAVRTGLFSAPQEKTIRAELYKLNVYGKSDSRISALLCRSRCVSREGLSLQVTQRHPTRRYHVRVTRTRITDSARGRFARPQAR